MSKHTPGPWSIEVLTSDDTETGDRDTLVTAYADADGLNGAAVASVNRWADGDDPATPESNANARLIAAAPDLLEALEQIAELDGDAEQQKFRLTRFQASQIARAAIHKVTRGQG